MAAGIRAQNLGKAGGLVDADDMDELPADDAAIALVKTRDVPDFELGNPLNSAISFSAARMTVNWWGSIRCGL
jgi:hypothetical protein